MRGYVDFSAGWLGGLDREVIGPIWAGLGAGRRAGSGSGGELGGLVAWRGSITPNSLGLLVGGTRERGEAKS